MCIYCELPEIDYNKIYKEFDEDITIIQAKKPCYACGKINIIRITSLLEINNTVNVYLHQKRFKEWKKQPIKFNKRLCPICFSILLEHTLHTEHISHIDNNVLVMKCQTCKTETIMKDENPILIKTSNGEVCTFNMELMNFIPIKHGEHHNIESMHYILNILMV